MSGTTAVALELRSRTDRTPADASRLSDPACSTDQLAIRIARVDEATAIHRLIAEYAAEGHLLPRSLEEVARRTHQFVVGADGGRILACAHLAPLSRTVAEVRSIVVAREARSRGVCRRMLHALERRAMAEGFDTLCAFTHAPGYFVRMGFSIVPHAWLPEKVQVDCHSCAQFRQCGQYAVMLPLIRSRLTCGPVVQHA